MDQQQCHLWNLYESGRLAIGKVILSTASGILVRDDTRVTIDHNIPINAI